MPFKCPHPWKSLAALGEMTNILKVFSNRVLQHPSNA
jgi:hypothetical protein